MRLGISLPCRAPEATTKALVSIRLDLRDARVDLAVRSFALHVAAAVTLVKLKRKTAIAVARVATDAGKGSFPSREIGSRSGRAARRLFAGGERHGWLRVLLYHRTGSDHPEFLGGEQCVARRCSKVTQTWRAHMPILLWLIGVPISVIVLLMLFGVLHI